MGLFVQCLYALSLHLVAVVFGTAIPTSLYIFGKCFIYLFHDWLGLGEFVSGMKISEQTHVINHKASEARIKLNCALGSLKII